MTLDAERAWRARLPGLKDECAEEWSLDLGEAFGGDTASLVVPAFLEDGAEAVLKLSFRTERASTRRTRFAAGTARGLCDYSLMIRNEELSSSSAAGRGRR